MNVKLSGSLSGSVTPPPSKSQAHRLLICAALGRRETTICCDSLNRDIQATQECLNAMGAGISYNDGVFHVIPIKEVKQGCTLPCGESGSTLRFLLPVAAVLETDALFTGKGKLPQRPIGTLREAMSRHGVSFSEENDAPAYLPLRCKGRLQGGDYTLDTELSSQYLSGLLLALPSARTESRLHLTGARASGSYVGMTLDALQRSGVQIAETADGYYIAGRQQYILPPSLEVEGDWSSAAFWLAAGCIGRNPVSCLRLNAASRQGDRRVADMLRLLGGDVRVTEDAVTAYPSALTGTFLDCADTPDLVPVLATVAACAAGDTCFARVGRLRYKESDRLAATHSLLTAFGIASEIGEDTLTVHGGRPVAACVNPFNDHRMAMSAAVLATAAADETLIDNADCVAKSYPLFFEHFAALGGKVSTF